MKYRFVIGFGCVAMAVMWLGSTPVATQFGQRQIDPAARQVETPRDENGHPVLGGIWVPTVSRDAESGLGDDGTFTRTFQGRKNSAINFERDSGVRQRVYVKDAKPFYKPQFWEMVKFNDVHGHNRLAPDPTFMCMPAGVPRIGFPQEIVQTDTTLYFHYPLHKRRVYIDGRPIPPVEQWFGTWFGFSVGHWEGDTMVIETVDFNGQEWMGWPGWYTSPDKRVTERITREGNVVTWEATVEDEYLLMQPWAMRPQVRQLNTAPFAEIEEPLPCLERDLQNMTTRERG